MKKLFLTLLLSLFLVSNTWAVSATFLDLISSGSSAFDCSPYDICQNLEGAGYDNSETWTETLNGATINEDYSTSPILGSQSLSVLDGGVDGWTQASFSAHADETVTHVYFQMRVDVDVSETAYIVRLYDGAGNAGYVSLLTNGHLKLYSGTGEDEGTTDVSGGGVFHVWFDWKTEIGSGNGIMHLYVSANSTKPGSSEATITNGTADYPGIDTLQIRATGSNNCVIIYDKILVSDSTIGSF